MSYDENYQRGKRNDYNGPKNYEWHIGQQARERERQQQINQQQKAWEASNKKTSNPQQSSSRTNTSWNTAPKSSWFGGTSKSYSSPKSKGGSLFANLVKLAVFGFVVLIVIGAMSDSAKKPALRGATPMTVDQDGLHEAKPSPTVPSKILPASPNVDQFLNDIHRATGLRVVEDSHLKELYYEGFNDSRHFSQRGFELAELDLRRATFNQGKLSIPCVGPATCVATNEFAGPNRTSPKKDRSLQDHLEVDIRDMLAAQRFVGDLQSLQGMMR